jgi:hypothetical protein
VPRIRGAIPRYREGVQPPLLRVQDGSVRIYRILDVADGIDLAQAEALASMPKSRVRLASPRSAIEIAHPPLRLGLGPRDVRIAGEPRRVEVQASLFDYGVASFLFELPVPPGTSPEDLLPLAEALLERPTPELDEVARGLAGELSAALSPALLRPHKWEGIETYTVFFVRAFDRRVTGSELLELAWLPRLLLGETDPVPLAAGERADVLKHRFAYLETDLAVVDWNSAFVHEPAGSTDVPDLLELATAQLLELRWYDGFLDRELAGIRGEVERAGNAGRHVGDGRPGGERGEDRGRFLPGAALPGGAAPLPAAGLAGVGAAQAPDAFRGEPHPLRRRRHAPRRVARDHHHRPHRLGDPVGLLAPLTP